jgi:hypothetical protein
MTQFFHRQRRRMHHPGTLDSFHPGVTGTIVRPEEKNPGTQTWLKEGDSRQKSSKGWGGLDVSGSFAALRMIAKTNRDNRNSNSRSPTGMTSKRGQAKEAKTKH